MKKIIAFGASNSKESINQQLAEYAAGMLENAQVEMLDLNDFEMPLYGIDKEKANGIPEKAHIFLNKIRETDGLIISFAEHNSSFTVAYKNVYDWVSRIEGNVWQEIPMLIISASPGGRGGISALEHAHAIYARRNKNLIKGLALPNFHDNFVPGKGIVDQDLKKQLEEDLQKFQKLL